MNNSSKSVTRRETLRGVIGLGLLGSVNLPLSCEGASRPDAGTALVHEFANAYLLAVCPKGKRICVYFTKHPEFSLAWMGGRWVKRENPSDAYDHLRVIEIGSWQTAYRTPLRERALQASFFADGECLYAETEPFANGSGLTRQQVLIDLQSGKQIENLRTEHRGSSGVYYRALQDRMLLGAEYSDATRRCTTLERCIWPGDAIATQAAFAVASTPDPNGHETDIFVSADRKKFVYASDHVIGCRNSSDLSLAWSRETERDYFGPTRLAISSNGNWVAAAVVDTTFLEQQRRYYVAVYSGLDGTLIAKLPLKGDSGLAISTDGKLLAVGERMDSLGRANEAELAASIFDCPSGKRLARFLHDRVRTDGANWVKSHFGVHGIQFTSDGKYLITSGTRTRIWEINATSKD